MKGNINNLMKQAQAMQANMAKAQAEIANIEVTGESGGGMVKITMSGKHEVKRVQIEPSVVSEDREMLEDLIAAATNDAVHKVEARVQEKMSSLTAGLQLPPSRSSFGSRFLRLFEVSIVAGLIMLNWRPITGPTGHRLSLISEPSIRPLSR